MLRERTTAVVREARIRLHVNGAEWLNVLATPQELDALAVGFLAGEGIIRGPADVRRVVVCPSQTCVEVWLMDAAVERPSRSTVTSGCGGRDHLYGPICASGRRWRRMPGSRARQLGRADAQIAGTPADAGDSHCGARRPGRPAARHRRHRAAQHPGQALRALLAEPASKPQERSCWRRVASAPKCSARRRACGRPSSQVAARRQRSQWLWLAAWNLTLVGYVRRDSLNVYTGCIARTRGCRGGGDQCTIVTTPG